MREHLQEEMRSKLDSMEEKETYKKRMHMVEPIFGNLKYNLGYETFYLRSHEKVTAEFKLMCIGNNLKKLWQFGLANVGETQNSVLLCETFSNKFPHVS